MVSLTKEIIKKASIPLVVTLLINSPLSAKPSNLKKAIENYTRTYLQTLKNPLNANVNNMISDVKAYCGENITEDDARWLIKDKIFCDTPYILDVNNIEIRDIINNINYEKEEYTVNVKYNLSEPIPYSIDNKLFIGGNKLFDLDYCSIDFCNIKIQEFKDDPKYLKLKFITDNMLIGLRDKNSVMVGMLKNELSNFILQEVPDNLKFIEEEKEIKEMKPVRIEILYNLGMENFKNKDYENALIDFDGILSMREDKRAEDMYNKTEDILRIKYENSTRNYEDKKYYGNALLSILRLEQLVNEYDDEGNLIRGKDNSEKRSELIAKLKGAVEYSVIITPFKTQHFEFNNFHNDLLTELHSVKPSNVSIIENEVRIKKEEIGEENELDIRNEYGEKIDANLIITGAITNFYVDTQQSSEMKFVRCKVGNRKLPNPEHAKLERIVDRLKYIHEQIDKQCKSQMWDTLGALVAEDEDAFFTGMLSSGVKCTKNPTVDGYTLNEAESKLRRTSRDLEEDIYDNLSYSVTNYKKRGQLKIDYRLIDVKNKKIFKSDNAEDYLEDYDSYTAGNQCKESDHLSLMSDSEIRTKLVSRVKNKIKVDIKRTLDENGLRFLEEANNAIINENKMDEAIENYLKFLISSKDVYGENDIKIEEAFNYINKRYNLDLNMTRVKGLF